ncbi:hypothetical protein J7L70_08545 [Candidatus Bathyarchaeota archaeon]|nr:hypothetical protein [Candidatus Bathyarchaeota archaeon]
MDSKVKLVLAALMVIALGIAIQSYYGEVEKFLLYASPVYRGFAIFALCLIGALTVIIPVPYTAVILTLAASVPEINLLEVALWGGFGSGLGEVVGWFLGKYLGESIGSSRYRSRLKVISMIMSKHRLLIPIIVFLFALTPLPDDALFIILGTVNYRLIYALASGIAGKIAMLYIIGLFGKLVGEYTPDWFSSVLAVALVLLFLALVEFVDWEKLAEKYLPGERGKFKPSDG